MKSFDITFSYNGKQETAKVTQTGVFHKVYPNDTQLPELELVMRKDGKFIQRDKPSGDYVKAVAAALEKCLYLFISANIFLSI